MVEGALTAPSPQQYLLFAIISTEFRGRFNEQSENDGAIVAGDFDQIGLCDQPAEFDQLARALAALHLPRPHVMPRRLRLQAVPRLHRSPMRRPCCGQ